MTVRRNTLYSNRFIHLQSFILINEPHFVISTTGNAKTEHKIVTRLYNQKENSRLIGHSETTESRETVTQCKLLI